MSEPSSPSSPPPGPGPEHSILRKDVGEWAAEIQVFAGPVPSTSRGSMSSRLTCGDTWLVSDYVGDSGFAGHGMWTWDRAKQKYVGVWADSMMGFLAPGEGTWDPDTRTMTYVHSATIDGREVRWRQITRTVDDDTQVFESFMPDTAESPMMRATYRRLKP